MAGLQTGILPARLRDYLNQGTSTRPSLQT